MNLRRFIMAGLADDIDGLEGGVVPSKNHWWFFEALHLEHSFGAVAFFVINLQTKEVLDAQTFNQKKPCYDSERNFEQEVAQEHYWVEPVFICSTDLNVVKSIVSSLNGNHKLFENCHSSLCGKILVDQELAA